MPHDSRSNAPLLLVGVDSQIGRALASDWTRGGRSFTGTSRRPSPSASTLFLDLADPQALQVLGEPPAMTAVVLAAISGEADCRRDPQLARQVNVDAVLTLAHWLARRDGFLVLASTRQVFADDVPWPGPDDPVSPAGSYGALKVAAELGVCSILGRERCAIVRFSKVVGPRFPRLQQWIEQARQGVRVHPFHDLMVSPVSESLVVTALSRIAQTRRGGILQVGGAEQCSYAELCRRSFQALGLDTGLIEPISAASVGLAPVPQAGLTWCDQGLALGAAESVDQVLATALGSVAGG